MSDLLPKSGALRAFVDLYAQTTEAPPEALLGTGLALFSAAVGWKAWVRWSESREPCTINIALAGRSATARKTTVAISAERLAREAMKDEASPMLRCQSVDHTSSKGLIELVAAPDEATARRWDTEPPPGLFLVWDEFGSVLGDPGTLRKGGDWMGQVRTTLMQMVHGRHGGIQTGAQKTPAGRCSVAIVATLTRVELEERVSTGLLRDGFLGRFTLIPHNGRDKYLSAPPAWTPAMLEARAMLVDWLRRVAQRAEPYGDIFALLTDGAQAVRDEWYQGRAAELDAQAAADASETNLAAAEAFGRLQSTAVKIAMLLAICDTSGTGPVAVDAEHIAYGQRIADACLAEIVDLARNGQSNVRDRYAERVIGFLRGREGPVSRGELQEKVTDRYLDREQRWRVVSDLHGSDDVTIVKVETSGRPREDVHLGRRHRKNSQAGAA